MSEAGMAAMMRGTPKPMAAARTTIRISMVKKAALVGQAFIAPLRLKFEATIPGKRGT